jgi:hypothetical protein
MIENNYKEDKENSFLYDTLEKIIYLPFENDVDAEFYIDKENIYHKENREKLEEVVLKYRKDFTDFIKNRYNYELSLDTESLIVLDIFIPELYNSEFFDDIKEINLLKKNLQKWVNYLGSYFLYYIKKSSRLNPNITYPIYDSYFVKDNEKIYPYLIAMQKISTNLSFENYDFFGELTAFILDEDFKYDQDYIKEVKEKNRALILNSYIRKN